MTTQCFVAEQNTGKKVPMFRWAGVGPWCWLPCTVGLHEAATRNLERPGLADRNYEEGDGKICTHSSHGDLGRFKFERVGCAAKRRWGG